MKRNIAVFTILLGYAATGLAVGTVGTCVSTMAGVAGDPNDFIPRLYYFDLAGRAESIRLACIHGGIAFEDIRLSSTDFQELKQSGKLSFGQVPALEVRENTVLVQSAAILRYVGKKTGLYPADPVSAAIVDAIIDEVRLVFCLFASQFNLNFEGNRPQYGANCVEVSRFYTKFNFLGLINYFIILFWYFMPFFITARFGFAVIAEKPDIITEVRKSLNDEVLPRHLKFLEMILERSATGWIASTVDVSIADFVIVPR